MKRIMIAAVAMLAAGAAQAQSQDAAKLSVQEKAPFGRYVADADGRTLYMFTKDEQGAETSTCYDACAEAWPPLLTKGEPTAADEVAAIKLGAFTRQDGTMQVTFDGWPLYYFVQDKGAGQVMGQDKHGFGGEWYVMAPDGQIIRKTAEEKAEAPK